ncbi:MAG: hypothetical protein CMJ22_10805, partial [Phycisphaerae bacterium]|nr:hypothetical protein [Phycisphaerae bacterium]
PQLVGRLQPLTEFDTSARNTTHRPASTSRRGGLSFDDGSSRPEAMHRGTRCRRTTARWECFRQAKF